MIPRRTWQMAASVAGAFIVGYFLYHTVEGDRGWVAEMHLQNQVNEAEATLAGLQKESRALAHRVHLMRPENLDPDLLDEESRKTLGYSKPDEITIMPPPDKPQTPPQ